MQGVLALVQPGERHELDIHRKALVVVAAVVVVAFEHVGARKRLNYAHQLMQRSPMNPTLYLHRKSPGAPGLAFLSE